MSDSVGSFVQQLTNPKVVNPLAAVQAGNEAANSYYQVQQQRANQALGQAYQGAVDPNTGVFDPNKFRALAAQNPIAAMAMGTGLSNVQQISSDELKQRFAKLDAWRTEAASLGDKDNPTYGDALAGVQRLVSAGVMTPAEAQAAIGTIPSDSPGIKTWARQHSLVLADASTRLEQIHGRPTTMVQGGQAQPGVIASPAHGGGFTPGGPPVQTGISPEKLNEPMTYISPKTGQSVNGTYGTWLQDHGIDPKTVYVGPQTGGGVAGNAPPGSPGAPGGTVAIPGTGRNVPKALTNPNKPAATSPAPAATPAPDTTTAPAAAPGAATPPTTTPPAAAAATASPMGTPSAVLSPDDRKMVQDHIAQGDAAQQQLANLGNMKADVANFATGSGADRTLDWKRFGQTWAGPIAKALGVESVSIASQEDFNKNVALMLQGQNAQSDKRLDVGIAATPHANLSPEGVQLIITKLQGNNDYLRARAQLGRQFLRNPANMQDYQDKLAQLDPRAFQFNRMDAGQRETYWKSLSTDAQKELLKAGNAAKALGVMQ